MGQRGRRVWLMGAGERPAGWSPQSSQLVSSSRHKHCMCTVYAVCPPSNTPSSLSQPGSKDTPYPLPLPLQRPAFRIHLGQSLTILTFKLNRQPPIASSASSCHSPWQRHVSNSLRGPEGTLQKNSTHRLPGNLLFAFPIVRRGCTCRMGL